MNDSFVFYRSFFDAIKNIPQENQLELYNALCEYSLNNNIPDDLSGVAKAMFILMKPNIDNARKRYTASVENGKKGGRPPKNKTQEKPNDNLDKTQEKPNDNLNVYVDVDVYKDKDKDINILSKEQLEKEFEEIWSMYPKKQGKANSLKAYIKARKNGVDKERIWNGLGNYINYIKANRTATQYIKNGSTWFNQECWNDDYSIAKKQEGVKKDDGNKYADGSIYAGLEC